MWKVQRTDYYWHAYLLDSINSKKKKRLEFTKKAK